MKQSLGEFPLLNRHTNQEEWATLYRPMDERNVQDFEQRWRPLMEERLATVSSQTEVQAANLQDIHWRWREKHQSRANRFDWDSFAVECDGVTQGLMFIRTFGFARIESQRDRDLIYIDLVSAAPWNRPGFTETPKYKGVGPLLLGAAVSYSINEGMQGRLALHALPQSETWYQMQGMTDLGSDHAHPESLTYFEFAAKDAQDYVAINPDFQFAPLDLRELKVNAIAT